MWPFWGTNRKDVWSPKAIFAQQKFWTCLKNLVEEYPKPLVSLRENYYFATIAFDIFAAPLLRSILNIFAQQNRVSGYPWSNQRWKLCKRQRGCPLGRLKVKIIKSFLAERSRVPAGYACKVCKVCKVCDTVLSTQLMFKKNQPWQFNVQGWFFLSLSCCYLKII